MKNSSFFKKGISMPNGFNGMAESDQHQSFLDILNIIIGDIVDI